MPQTSLHFRRVSQTTNAPQISKRQNSIQSVSTPPKVPLQTRIWSRFISDFIFVDPLLFFGTYIHPDVEEIHQDFASISSNSWPRVLTTEGGGLRRFLPIIPNSQRTPAAKVCHALFASTQHNPALLTTWQKENFWAFAFKKMQSQGRSIYRVRPGKYLRRVKSLSRLRVRSKSWARESCCLQLCASK